MKFKKKANKDIFKKVVVGLLVAVALIVGSVFKHQTNEIETLKHDLYIKQEVVAQERDYTESEVIAKSIEDKFNETGDLIVVEGKMSMKHKYVLDETIILGLKQNETLVATADCYYQFITPLNEAKVTVKNGAINIKIPDVQLNKDATHKIPNTMHVIQDESGSSLFSTKETAKMAAIRWSNTFDMRANERIEGLYKQQELRDEAVKQISQLIGNLLGKDSVINITVE